VVAKLDGADAVRQEDIEIRISKTGEVYVKITGASEERVRDYHAFLEDMIGPVQSISRLDAPDWEKPAELTDEEQQRRSGELRLER
jgi:hypothetical protein